MASIAAFSLDPERIKELFLIKQKNENGIYSILLRLCGVWNAIILDDYLPCIDNEKPQEEKAKPSQENKIAPEQDQKLEDRING